MVYPRRSQPSTDKSVASPPTMRSAGFRCALGARVLKKIPVNNGGQERQEGQEEQKSLIFLSFLSFLSFPFSLSGAPRPQAVDSRRLAVGGWHLPCCYLSGDQAALFSLPLLVAKVAQKPRTTSLAESRVAKPKTNASQAKRLPSSFLNGFATFASRDRQIGRLPADDAKCGFSVRHRRWY